MENSAESSEGYPEVNVGVQIFQGVEIGRVRTAWFRHSVGQHLKIRRAAPDKGQTRPDKGQTRPDRGQTRPDRG